MRASSGADAVFTSAPTAFTQSSTTASSVRASAVCLDVVLVLPDADRLRLDPHQFGERVLQAPRDRHRAAQRDVEVGELLRRELGGGIDRRAGLGDDHLGQLELRVTRDQIAGELVGLARRGAVADRDERRRGGVAASRPSVRDRARPSRCAARAGRSSRCRARLPVPSTTATFTPVRSPGSRPIVTRGPAGAASSRSCRLRPKTWIASCFGALAQTRAGPRPRDAAAA